MAGMASGESFPPPSCHSPNSGALSPSCPVASPESCKHPVGSAGLSYPFLILDLECSLGTSIFEKPPR